MGNRRSTQADGVFMLMGEPVPFDSRAVTITPAQAQRTLEECGYPRQRPARAVTLGSLGLMMDDGAFRPGSQISIARLGRQRFLIDGWHRLTLVAERGARAFTLTVYKCTSMAQVHNLYITYDTGIGDRSMPDMFAALYGPAVVSRVGKRNITALISAVGQIANEFAETFRRIQRHYVPRYCRAAHAFLPQLTHFHTLIRGVTPEMRKRLHKQSTLSVALVTLKHQPRQASQFWSVVAHGGSGRRSDPRSAFRDFLNRNEPFRKRTAYSKEMPYTPRQLAHITAWSWNMHYANKRVKLIDPTVAVSKGPIFIEGTSFAQSRCTNNGTRRGATDALTSEQRKLVLKNAQVGKTRGVPDYAAGSPRKGQQVLPSRERK